MKQGRLAVIGTGQGLANSVIHDIEEDARGFFWISSHGGIMRVSKAELNRCADGEADSVIAPAISPHPAETPARRVRDVPRGRGSQEA